MFDPGEAPDPDYKDLSPQPKVQLVSGREYVRSALLATTRPEFREFSDVTLALEDGQVQSYRSLLALLSPWLGELLLAAGGGCDRVILPGTDCQGFMGQFEGAMKGEAEKWEAKEGIGESLAASSGEEDSIEANNVSKEDVLVKKEDSAEVTLNQSMFSILKESFPDLPESAAFSIEYPQVDSCSFNFCSFHSFSFNSCSFNSCSFNSYFFNSCSFNFCSFYSYFFNSCSFKSCSMSLDQL